MAQGSAAPKLRNGVIRRGNSWSYVIRVTDSAGVSKPRWVGGFPTEAAAKRARDEARIAAGRGEFVDRSTLTVQAYLDQWPLAHTLEVKPSTGQARARSHRQRPGCSTRRSPSCTGGTPQPAGAALGAAGPVAFTAQRAGRWPPRR